MLCRFMSRSVAPWMWYGDKLNQVMRVQATLNPSFPLNLIYVTVSPAKYRLCGCFLRLACSILPQARAAFLVVFFFVSMKPYVLCTKHTVNHTLSNELLLLTHIVKWKCLSTACQTWVFLVLVTSQGWSDISSHEKHQTFWPQPVFCTLQDTL